MRRPYFAVYQAGHAIVGAGEMREIAVEESYAFLVPGTVVEHRELDGPRGDIAGQIYCRPCTRRLFRDVVFRGGNSGYEITNEGYLDLSDANKSD